MPANSRRTINVETVDPRLANAAVSTTIASDVGIVVERAMYWPDIAQGWREAHNSFGVTETGLRWGVADGRIGGRAAIRPTSCWRIRIPCRRKCRCASSRAPASARRRTYTLPPTSRLNISASGDVPELGEGTFSAEIQVLNYQPIAVEKAMYWNAEGVIWAAGTNVTATRFPHVKKLHRRDGIRILPRFKDEDTAIGDSPQSCPANQPKRDELVTTIRKKAAATMLALALAAATLQAHDNGRGQPPAVHRAILNPPADQRAFLIAHAIGTQNYMCLPSA